jgi:hypothetical protein
MPPSGPPSSARRARAATVVDWRVETGAAMGSAHARGSRTISLRIANLTTRKEADA